MKPKNLLMTLIGLAAILMAACSSQKPQAQAPASAPQSSAALIPDAVIYRMNGDWNQYVPVSVNSTRTALTSFPAPSDITPDQIPIRLDDGWWLDRRGIGPNSAFTSYTYAQYAALPQAPRPAELLNSIMPGSGVTEIVVLPLKLQQAQADIPAVNRLIRDGLPGCKQVYKK